MTAISRQLINRFWLAWVLAAAVWPAAQTLAASTTLKSVDFTSLPGDNLQLVFALSGPATQPKVFHTDNPARIALDLLGVGNGLEKKPISINVGGAQTLQAVESAGRTRVVINLASMVPYTSRVDGSNIILTLQNGGGSPVATAPKARPNGRYTARPAEPMPVAENYDSYGGSGRRVENVDFRRGERGEGRLLVTLSDPKAVSDIREEGRRVIVKLRDTELPRQLMRRMDVLDFATPVQFVESRVEGSDTLLVVTPVSEEYDYSSYQSGRVLTVELRPLTRAEKEEVKKKSFAYSGEKLTLNFQDIPVRSVLQILADFTNLNIIASDTVQGNVTLRLQDVPWDQALDLVLKAKGLGKRQEGNIIRVAPIKEINDQEKDELEAAKVVEELEPLRTEIIQVSYTTAEDLKKVLIGTTERSSTGQTGTDVAISNKGVGGAATVDITQSILSGRGNVTVDARTNQLIVKDTPRNLERIRDLVRQLDKPVRQVLIESRIVIANNDFTRELGSRLSLNRAGFVERSRGKTFNQVDPNPVTGQLESRGFREVYGDRTAQSYDALVDLASAAAAASGGAFGLTLLKAGDYLLDLELSAAQIDGRGEIVSNPRLITSDQTKAVIKQGVQIPYQTTVVAGGGQAANIQFKNAVLELNVTPHITPDDNIRMNLMIRKDAPGQQTTSGPAIDTREIETTAQVGNGETVVLGGVFEGTQTYDTNKVPFFGDLPGIGFMFRRDRNVDTKKELLIFITPKILSQSLAAR